MRVSGYRASKADLVELGDSYPYHTTLQYAVRDAVYGCDGPLATATDTARCYSLAGVTVEAGGVPFEVE